MRQVTEKKATLFTHTHTHPNWYIIIIKLGGQRNELHILTKAYSLLNFDVLGWVALVLGLEWVDVLTSLWTVSASSRPENSVIVCHSWYSRSINPTKKIPDAHQIYFVSFWSDKKKKVVDTIGMFWTHKDQTMIYLWAVDPTYWKHIVPESENTLRKEKLNQKNERRASKPSNDRDFDQNIQVLNAGNLVEVRISVSMYSAGIKDPNRNKLTFLGCSPYGIFEALQKLAATWHYCQVGEVLSVLPCCHYSSSTDAPHSEQQAVARHHGT